MFTTLLTNKEMKLPKGQLRYRCSTTKYTCVKTIAEQQDGDVNNIFSLAGRYKNTDKSARAVYG